MTHSFYDPYGDYYTASSEWSDRVAARDADPIYGGE
jgi:hypothetical protein